MITYTCQILIGQACSPYSGLTPGSIRQLLLTENDRPSWRLFDFSIENTRRPLAIWIPQRHETMLEDAFLMVALLVTGDLMCRRYLEPHLSQGVYGVDMSVDLPNNIATGAREVCRESSHQGVGSTKLIISPFLGSAISRQLRCVPEYGFDSEVLEPKFCCGRLGISWESSVPTDALCESAQHPAKTMSPTGTLRPFYGPL